MARAIRIAGLLSFAWAAIPRIGSRTRAVVFIAVMSAGLTGCLPSADPYVFNLQTLTSSFPTEVPEIHNVRTVTPGVLVRGGQPSKRGLRTLRDQFGIRTIVNFNDLTNDSEAQPVAQLGLNYLPLRDNPFEEAGDRELYLAFLKTVRDQQNNGPVYVHCRTGSDRVGLAVGIYRIVECGWDAKQALAELRQYQPYHTSVFFHRYPAILRDVEANRDEWLQALDTMPDPPLQRPSSRPRLPVDAWSTAATRAEYDPKVSDPNPDLE